MKVISGGQTGADQAGLEAAIASDIETGGWMPAGFLTSGGLRPSFADRYGMKDTSSRGYPDRTRKNVEASDGTIWFGNPRSPGGKLTIRTAKKLGKPVLKIRFDTSTSKVGWKVAHWIRLEEIETVNIAGNREESNPGIYEFTYKVMLTALSLVTTRRRR